MIGSEPRGMANGSPSSEPEAFVLRSGVRSGLKREFAFAIRSQAEISLARSRTRSGGLPSPSHNPKRIKRADGIGDAAPAPGPDVPAPGAPIVESDCAVAEGKISPADRSESETGGSTKSSVPPGQVDDKDGLKEERAEGIPVDVDDAHQLSEMRSDLKSAAETPTDGEPKEDDCPVENVPPEGAEKALMEVEQKEDGMKAESVVGTPTGMEIEAGERKAESDPPDNEAAPKNTTSSASEVVSGVSDNTPLGTDGTTGTSVENPTIVEYQQEAKVEIGATAKPSIKFKRLAMKVLKENSLIVRSESGLPEKSARRFTRSLMKTPTSEDPVAEEKENSGTTKAGVSGDEGNSGGSTPSKKMELKMSKKIALHKFPNNVRELLNTGLLEGLPVKYRFTVGKHVGLDGVVNGNGILCSCNLCKGSNVVSAYNFELHAHSTKKHPSDYIYLENGKSLRNILTECRSAPLEMLEAAIQNAIGPLPQRKPSVCQNCKESFRTPRTGKLGLLCDSCLLSKQQLQTTPTQPQRTPSNAKLSGKLLSGCASDVSSKITSSQKKIVQGKITRKDLGLHKLVFMDDILPEGTEVGYYIRGKRLREGYIKDSGIYCRCCNSVVSPSQFEAHAGQAARRKPYNNIYTSNGVSLHELSVSLSAGRKMSSSENDDLCSICADGGDLLCCDHCPRAFHKECVGLPSIPRGDWSCRYCYDIHQKEKSVRYNDNAIAAGRVAGVDPIEQIIKRCIRIVTTSTDFGACVLCRCHDFSKSGFDGRTVLICDQCEKEYHVGCLKDHEMCDLKELPEGEWFCCADCTEIHAALSKLLLRGSEPLQSTHKDIIRKKLKGKGVSKDATEVRWRLLSGKTSSDDTKLLLSEAVSIFHESFDPIIDAATGRDLIPSMVYGRSVRDQDFGGMYCAILTVNSSVVSAGILRVLGSDIAELPLVATSRESQGQGYFQSLFSCIERVLEALKVKHFVLPSAEEAESIWTKKFGFSRISLDQLYKYTKGARPIIFEGTSLLHKPVPISKSCLQENHGSC
ncbi:uncharacterized protein M6B38_299395 [Iris pallida]|uniref:PHD-type domain-containing protein n=1 Tax=Iris pallida TaxID=29817 RepID=A0AAX6HPL7_IRIPA|nr:uncharacterized protein M6B38_299395 [Iris pallida]